MKIGAWTGFSALSDPEKTLKILKHLDINLVDIMINNGSVIGNQFTIYKTEAKIIEVCDLFHKNNIEVSLTTWAQPNAQWLSGIKNVVVPLAQKANVVEIVLDLEEAWYKSKEVQKDPVYWSNQLKDCFENYNGEVAVTCQANAGLALIEPTFDWVNTIIPQAYSTNTTVVKWPGTLPGPFQKSVIQKYSKWAGPKTLKRLIIGLAAYNQDNIKNLSIRESVESALKSCKDNDINEVRFWRLETINEEILSAIRNYQS